MVICFGVCGPHYPSGLHIHHLAALRPHHAGGHLVCLLKGYAHFVLWILPIHYTWVNIPMRYSFRWCFLLHWLFWKVQWQIAISSLQCILGIDLSNMQSLLLIDWGVDAIPLLAYYCCLQLKLSVVGTLCYQLLEAQVQRVLDIGISSYVAPVYYQCPSISYKAESWSLRSSKFCSTLEFSTQSWVWGLEPHKRWT